ncbi:nitric oxide synthase oxygenase [Alicyclobacillus tolerans]|uniref:nitric oxide synthase oxygenase n=1 Tax=Alicyclobacillus tolerans TaxID=90970 RepID=UPI003B77BFBD
MFVDNEVQDFILRCYNELGKSREETEYRLNEIKKSLQSFGTFEFTYEELEHGARMAWRNSNRCIGRLFWKSLKVFDERNLHRVDQIAFALFRHIQYASNEGKIRPTITIFHQDIRIWNHQLIRYAGYETEHGIIGDSHSVKFTRICQQLGWVGKGTAYDILPIVIQVQNEAPVWYSIPEDIILEIPIHHPEYPLFDELHLQWYAVPILSDMALEIGGIRFPAAPFNGWYMETEIGARNLADTNRYNILPKVASIMGLDTKNDASLWKDKALIELNIAVLHSYKNHGVTIIDHHTAAKQFERFEQIEADAGRKVTGDWTWLIPPVSPATTHIFHSQYDNTLLSPNYFHQTSPYSSWSNTNMCLS